MGETVPCIQFTGISDGARVVKWNIFVDFNDFSDYLFINFTSGYREELL